MSVQPPESSKIVKQYKYRQSVASSLLLLLLLGAFAVSNYGNWVVGSFVEKIIGVFVVLVFLLVLQISIAGTFGNLKLFLTEEGLYLPNLFLGGKFRYVSFARVVRTRKLNMMGNEMLELHDGPKNFVVTNSWLPEKGAFEEIVEYILARIPENAKTG